MADIVYIFGGKPYLNITNECPCRCEFCIRKNGDGLGSADNLWHRKTPSVSEVEEAVKNFDFSQYDEVIFCGYGEPLCELDSFCAACEIIKNKYPQIKIRLNTNGLGDIINGQKTVPVIAKYLDTVSISLNAPTKEKYNELCHPQYGLESFDAMLQFAKECVGKIPTVKMTVVDVISGDDIEKCRILAESVGAKFRVRQYTTE